MSGNRDAGRCVGEATETGGKSHPSDPHPITLRTEDPASLICPSMPSKRSRQGAITCSRTHLTLIVLSCTLERNPAISAATQPRLSTACHVLPGLPARRLGKPWVSSEVTRWRAVSHPEPRQSAQQPVCSVQVWWEQCVRRVWARHSRPMGWDAQWVLGAGHRCHGDATQHLSHPRLVLVSSAQFLCKWQK